MGNDPKEEMRLVSAFFLFMATVVCGKFPATWGQPPDVQTMDIRMLPGGYGHGSSTMVGWITSNMEKEKRETGRVSYPPEFGEVPRMQTRDLRKLPFGYGRGSGTIATWLAKKAQEVYGVSVEEYDAEFKTVEEHAAKERPPIDEH